MGRKQYLNVPIEKYLHVYKSIKERHKQYEFARVYRISDIDSKFSRPLISELMYNRLLDFHDTISNFSFIGKPVVEDTNQKIHYYRSLLDLINSDAFQHYTHKEKTAVLVEQINTGKQIN